MDPGLRLGIGIAGLLLVVAGFVVEVQQGGATGGVLIRAGVIAGAAWLVAPLVRRPAPATLVLVGSLALVVARPRLLLPLVIAAVLWWLARRQRLPR